MGDVATVTNQMNNVDEVQPQERAAEPIARERIETLRERYRTRAESLRYAHNELRACKGNHEQALGLLDAKAKAYALAEEDLGYLLGKIPF